MTGRPDMEAPIVFGRRADDRQGRGARILAVTLGLTLIAGGMFWLLGIAVAITDRQREARIDMCQREVLASGDFTRVCE